MTVSPYQDDIVVLYVTGEYASCLEISLKTEFITMLSRKIKEKTDKSLKIDFASKWVEKYKLLFTFLMFCNFYSIEFTTKKGKIGSDKRKINFVIGNSDQMNIKTSGLINKDATISIGTGLPNTTSKHITLLSSN